MCVYVSNRVCVTVLSKKCVCGGAGARASHRMNNGHHITDAMPFVGQKQVLLKPTYLLLLSMKETEKGKKKRNSGERRILLFLLEDLKITYSVGLET